MQDTPKRSPMPKLALESLELMAPSEVLAFLTSPAMIAPNDASIDGDSAGKEPSEDCSTPTSTWSSPSSAEWCEGGEGSFDISCKAFLPEW